MAAEYTSAEDGVLIYDQEADAEIVKQTFQLISFLLAGDLGIIGVSPNLVNTITSDVFSRKIELAAMQSIGMTKRQC